MIGSWKVFLYVRLLVNLCVALSRFGSLWVALCRFMIQIFPG